MLLRCSASLQALVQGAVSLPTAITREKDPQRVKTGPKEPLSPCRRRLPAVHSDELKITTHHSPSAFASQACAFRRRRRFSSRPIVSCSDIGGAVTMMGRSRARGPGS